MARASAAAASRADGIGMAAAGSGRLNGQPASIARGDAA
jgi:hypothetical protein